MEASLSRRRRRAVTRASPEVKQGPRANLNLLTEGKIALQQVSKHAHERAHRATAGVEPFLDQNYPRDASNPLDAFLDSHSNKTGAAAAAEAPAAKEAANATAANGTAKSAAAVQISKGAAPPAPHPIGMKPAFYPMHPAALSGSAGSSPVAPQQVSLLQYLNKPSALRLAQMQAEKVDTNGMNKQQLRLAGVSDPMTIFTFSPVVDTTISAAIAISGSWEGDKVKKICDLYLQHSGNFLDVGANIGTFTLPMSGCLKGKGNVIAVEGMPTTAKHLKASIVANSLSNVVLYNYAVGNEVPENEIKMDFNIANPGGSSVVNGNSVNYGVEGTGIYASGKNTESIGLTTLDAMYQSNPDLKNVLAMKMDIEGNEGRAIHGATKFFQEHPPCYLMVELDPSWLRNAGTPIDDIKARLTKFGYEIPQSVGQANYDTYMIQQKNLDGCIARLGSKDSKEH